MEASINSIKLCGSTLDASPTAIPSTPWNSNNGNLTGRLIGSFLTGLPDEFKKAIEQHPDLKLISVEKLTPEMFKAHEASRQESL